MAHDVTTPECPHCGCNATEPVAAGMRSGSPWCVFRCDFCEKEFNLGRVPVKSNGVPYRIPHPQLACPRCHRKKKSGENWSRSSPASTGRMKTRLLKCPNCNFAFATYEDIDAD